MRDKFWYTEKDEIHQQDLETRKHEWEWKKKVKTLQKAKQSVSFELQTSIPDSETVWKTDQEELKKQLSLQLLDEQDEEEEIEIIVNTAGNENLQWLGQDYISLQESSEDSSNSSSESQYSTDFWNLA